MKNYEFDIAISLCKQDIPFAQRLISFLNPGLKIFFYENNQEVLINKSGPQAFAEIFRDKSRVVVVLSRDEWSESYYTNIERNAIIDRTSVKNEGYHFLFVIPMEPHQVPPWYPSTRIYADPTRFSIDRLATFIEFKVTELGGIIKPVTLEDRHDQFLKKVEEKKLLVQLQETVEAVDAGMLELDLVKNIFNKKIDSLKKMNWSRLSYLPFSGLQSKASVEISNYELRCTISEYSPYVVKASSTQEYMVQLELFQITNTSKDLMKKWLRVFFFGIKQRGWAVPIYCELEPTRYELQLLFRGSDNQRYDLSDPQSSDELVDSWFQELFILATGDLNKFLKS